MNLLFVHYSIPSQFVHIIRELARRKGVTLMAIGRVRSEHPVPESLRIALYGLSRGNAAGIHPLAAEFESKMIRADACAHQAFHLKAEGYRPDLICAHPGWGEALFLKDLWPDVPLLTYQEFSYQATNSDLDFDPEFSTELEWQQLARSRVKQANVLLNLEASDWCVTPTHFQHSTFPSAYHSRISVIHDGINCQLACPNPSAPALQLPNGPILHRDDQLITFVSRTLEPYRGIHSFLRAVPLIQKYCPEAQIVIVGEAHGASYGKPCTSHETWLERFLGEIEGQHDPARLHLVGPMGYSVFLHLLQLSSVHVYLTYPFVLSWSLLEAMACGSAVVGSATAPVQEVIRHGHNGLLVDFFSPSDLAAAVAELLQQPLLAAKLGAQARQTIKEHYSLGHCVPQQLALMELVRQGTLSAR